MLEATFHQTFSAILVLCTTIQVIALCKLDAQRADLSTTIVFGMLSTIFRAGRHIRVTNRSFPSRGLFISHESTPNPHSIKFKPEGEVEVLPASAGTGIFIQKGDRVTDINKSPLAKQLFTLDGVKGVFLGRDFITGTFL